MPFSTASWYGDGGKLFAPVPPAARAPLFFPLLYSQIPIAARHNIILAAATPIPASAPADRLLDEDVFPDDSGSSVGVCRTMDCVEVGDVIDGSVDDVVDADAEVVLDIIIEVDVVVEELDAEELDELALGVN